MLYCPCKQGEKSIDRVERGPGPLTQEFEDFNDKK